MTSLTVRLCPCRAGLFAGARKGVLHAGSRCPAGISGGPRTKSSASTGHRLSSSASRSSSSSIDQKPSPSVTAALRALPYCRSRARQDSRSCLCRSARSRWISAAPVDSATSSRQAGPRRQPSGSRSASPCSARTRSATRPPRAIAGPPGPPRRRVLPPGQAPGAWQSKRVMPYRDSGRVSKICSVYLFKWNRPRGVLQREFGFDPRARICSK